MHATCFEGPSKNRRGGADQLLSAGISFQHQVPHQSLLLWKLTVLSIRCYDMRPLTLSLRHRSVVLGHMGSSLTQALKYYSSYSEGAVDGPARSINGSAFGAFKILPKRR